MLFLIFFLSLAFFFNFLLIRGELWSYKDIYNWVSGTYCSNTSAFISVHSPPSTFQIPSHLPTYLSPSYHPIALFLTYNCPNSELSFEDQFY